MRLVVLFILCLLMFACSNSVGVESLDSSYVELSGDTLSGMVRVTAVRAKAYLGTDDSMAAISERPAMVSQLDYSFSMGRSEVTCSEFNDLMESATGLFLDCENDSLPATDISYYDAILFANEKSKASKMDTVYSYTAATFDDNHHCMGMEGFAYHPEIEAYRLPTEAEWVLVAQENWDLKKSWTSENSEFRLHPVCSLETHESGVCDMAGNAMEWVNDWLGYFKDTTISNYAGGPDGGTLGERVVKGGSYQNSRENINTYSRGDVYTVTSSTRAPYVGFRLAYGKIPEATWIGYNGYTMTSRVTPLLNSSSLQSISRTYKMKLVFRNNVTGNLSFIDYSSGVVYVSEIVDSLSVYHPDISPNGSFALYSTGIEGVSGKSEVYLQELSLSARKAFKIETENATIPRWTVFDNGDTAIVYVSDGGNNKDNGTFFSHSTWLLPFKNSMLGKPKKLFDGAYHGGLSEDRRLAVSGARLLRARIADKNSTVTGKARDTVWYDGYQACNVSLAQDGSKRTLFLDFGGEPGRQFVGKKYGVHERILVADSTGKLIQSVAAPSGYAFDHVEWTHGLPDYAVATLSNAQGAHTKIVLVNVNDGKILELAEGEDLWHPAFWAHNSINSSKYDLDPDSAGAYMGAHSDFSSILMRYKMELLWQYRDTANTVILGSSRPLMGVCSWRFNPKIFAINLAHTPNSIYASRDFLDLYLYKHVKHLKYVILSLDIDFWHKVDGPSGDNFFETASSQYPGFVYDKNHNYWESGYPEGLLEYTQNFLGVSNDKSYLFDRGRFSEPCMSWGDSAELELDSTYFDKREYLLENSLATLEDIIRKAKERGVIIVGVIFPQNPKYRNTGAFGRYGLRRSRAEKLIKEIGELEGIYDNFKLLDENKMGYHDYKSSMAHDHDHLCSTGSFKMSTRLDSLLNSLE